MDFSRAFILRPAGTFLLAVGLMIVGIIAYLAMPVASMPNVEFPTLRVSASRPGADPETMASSIAAPLERRLGEIAGVTEMTSVSALGSSNISLQFDLTRNVEDAARDVQGAINAAATDLPAGLPALPQARKFNPSAAPVIVLALTSDTETPQAIYDVADTVIVQRLSQVSGVGDVSANGAAQPAIRVRVDAEKLAPMGLSLDDLRNAIGNSNVLTSLGAVDGPQRMVTLRVNDELRAPQDYKGVVVRSTPDGRIVRLSDVAQIDSAPKSAYSAAFFNGRPAVLLVITKQATANIVDTVDRVKAALPGLSRWIPADINIDILTDRSTTIRASVGDMQRTLGLSVLLVMLVVFLFLGRATPTLAAGITVPLSLAGTCALMWASGFSINNLTLMAFAVAVGFVVDDAIVMIENIHRGIEAGQTPMRAALAGARQIGFTVMSISISLVAAFFPVIFMGGLPGRFLHEFSLTLVYAIAVSTAVSLSVTPMICAHFLRREREGRRNLLDRAMASVMGGMLRFYSVTLEAALKFRWLTLLAFFATIGATVWLFIATPKGDIPQDDSGFLMGGTEANADISFGEMARLQGRAAEIVKADPAVASVGSSMGATGFNASLNQGRLFISLKPLAERGGATTTDVTDRLRKALRPVTGLTVTMFMQRDVRTGARSSKALYQFTLWDPDLKELLQWLPKAVDAFKTVDSITDVSTDREQGALQLDVAIDREAAAQFGVPVANIINALSDAFSQRQVSTLYTARNQYSVILEVDPSHQRGPADLNRIYVPGREGAQVPLASLVKTGNGFTPLVVNHQGPFPAVTLSYNLKPGVSLQAAAKDIDAAMAAAHAPDTLHAEPAGDAKSFTADSGSQPLLIIAALMAVYIVLGVLYESLAHPLTILSTLPSAGLGALLALQIAGMELNIIGFIGVILLIGIVKKNGIMLVDFALEAERVRGLPPSAAIRQACLERFRPILMTTLAAVLGALPLVLALGPGSELRRPLGVTIVGGLLVSQVLTLYTTPVIYLMLDWLHLRLRPRALTASPTVPAAPQTR